MKPPANQSRRRVRNAVAASALAVALLVLASSSASLQLGSRGGTQRSASSVPLPPMQHNLTAVCSVTSFAADEPPGCSDTFARPFSGCLTDEYEFEQIHRLLEGREVPNLMCGFMDQGSQGWLADIHRRFGACQYVVYTAGFSYGSLSPTAHVTPEGGAGVCFAAFVDADTVEKLGGAPSFNDTHYGLWELVVMDPGMLSDTAARSAHMVKGLAARLFPSSAAALYLDIKVAPPPDPLQLMQQLESSGRPVLVGVVKHPDEAKRDVFDEIVQTQHHLLNRRLRPDPARDKSVVLRRQAYTRGITGRDFHDIFRQYMLFARVNYPMFHTGMFNAATLVWNLRNPCTAAAACLWHNQVARYSMREQLNFHYIINVLGLTDQVLAITPIDKTGDGLELQSNLTLQPTGWLKWGDQGPDEFW